MADSKFKVSPGLEDRLLGYAAAVEALREHDASLVPALPPGTFVADMTEAAALIAAQGFVVIARQVPQRQTAAAIMTTIIDTRDPLFVEQMRLGRDHDQMAIAEAQHPGRFFGRCEPMPLRVDAVGYTRVDKTRGRPVTVCIEPTRDAFMTHYLAQLASK